MFGCIAFVHVHSHNRSKLDPRARNCVFIRYSPKQKGYKCYDTTTKKVFVSRDVTFENTPYFQKPNLQGENLSEAPFLGIDMFDMSLSDIPEPIFSKSSQSTVPSFDLEPVTPSHSNLPSLEGNLNSRGDAKE